MWVPEPKAESAAVWTSTCRYFRAGALWVSIFWITVRRACRATSLKKFLCSSLKNPFLGAGSAVRAGEQSSWLGWAVGKGALLEWAQGLLGHWWSWGGKCGFEFPWCKSNMCNFIQQRRPSKFWGWAWPSSLCPSFICCLGSAKWSQRRWSRSAPATATGPSLPAPTSVRPSPWPRWRRSPRPCWRSWRCVGTGGDPSGKGSKCRGCASSQLISESQTSARSQLYKYVFSVLHLFKQSNSL